MKTKTFTIIIIVWASIATTAKLLFHLSWLEYVLLLLSIGGIIWLLDAAMRPVLNRHNRKVAERQKIIDAHITLALCPHDKKEQMKLFKKGAAQQHIIYARNEAHARKIYQRHFNDKHKNDKRGYFWVNARCNSIYNVYKPIKKD